MSALLEVEDLVVEFDTPKGRRRVVDQVSFAVAPGEVLGILGESGSGKTMSTMAVLGLVAGDPGVMGGRITLHEDGRQHQLLASLESTIRPGRGDQPPRKNNRRWNKLARKRMKPLWGRMMTAVFQNPRHSLDPLMTVGKQVEESIRLTAPKAPKAEIRQRAVEWLDRVQMNEPERVHGSYPHELSGGMCQRAMIAVALAREPRLLIADEPTTGLDTTVRAEIVGLFKQLLADSGRAMLYISHDVREVLFLADRIIVMRHGRIVEAVTSAAVLAGDGTRDPYTASLLAAADLEEAA